MPEEAGGRAAASGQHHRPDRAETSGQHHRPDRAETYGYHQPFLPEYVTTIAISLAANWIVLTLSEAGQDTVEGNPHVYGAAAAYTAAIFTLLGLTFYHRYRFCTVTLTDTGIKRRLFGFAFTEIPFGQIEKVEERRATFFGRAARVLAVRTHFQEELTFADFMFRYDELREELLRRAKKDLTNQEPLSEEEYESLRQRVVVRDAVFGRPGLHTVRKRLPFRLLGLMPVVCVELAGALLVIYEVFGRGPEGRGNPLSVYAGAVTLAISAVVARFTYYYIFSTHWAERQ